MTRALPTRGTHGKLNRDAQRVLVRLRQLQRDEVGRVERGRLGRAESDEGRDAPDEVPFGYARPGAWR